MCEDDDFVIVEEYTYPSAQALWIPMGIKAVPVAADAQGIQADSLRELLQTWDEKARGSRRPTVSVVFVTRMCCAKRLTIARLYLVPVGSNPTGTTISAPRRREIYDICVEFGMASHGFD